MLVIYRGAALSEAAVNIKREIYAYRSNTGSYSQPRFRNPALASAIKRVTSNLMSTEAAVVSLERMPDFDLSAPNFRRDVLQLHADDDAVSPMHITDYNEQRLQFQQERFRADAKRLASRLKLFEYVFRRARAFRFFSCAFAHAHYLTSNFVFA